MSIDLTPSISAVPWHSPAVTRPAESYPNSQTQSSSGNQAATPRNEQNTSSDDSQTATDRISPKTNASSGNGQETELTEQESRLLRELQAADQEVRQHELAHIAAGGQYVTSGAKFEYRRGPDGRNYAVAGEVSIDTSPIPGDPAATAEKMRAIQRAALAPASPSSQDRKVAAQASSEAAQATAELMALQAKMSSGSVASSAARSPGQAASAYAMAGQQPSSPPGSQLNISV